MSCLGPGATVAYLIIYNLSSSSFFLPLDAFDDLLFLKKLHFWGSCLNRTVGVRLPPSPQQLTVTQSCLQEMGDLADIFPDLANGSSSGNAWTPDMLNLSFNQKMRRLVLGPSKALKLKSLYLGNTKIEAAALSSLRLRQPVCGVMLLELGLPAESVARLELKELNLRGNMIGLISQEALASCHSLESLDLQATGLSKLLLGFPAAIHRLWKLNLAGNQLQSAMCMNGTGAGSGLLTLNLSYNKLRVLLPATFSCLLRLRELLLQGNQLVSLEGQVFQGLLQLETLNLDSNPLMELGEGWLVTVPALTTLSLLDTLMLLSPAWGFGGAESLHTLGLQLPSAPTEVILTLLMSLMSLELHTVSGKYWELSPNVFPVLQTLTLKGKGLHLGIHNASKVFSALHQQSLLGGSSLDALCSQDTNPFYLWQLPRCQSLSKTGDLAHSQALPYHPAAQPVGAQASVVMVP